MTPLSPSDDRPSFAAGPVTSPRVTPGGPAGDAWAPPDVISSGRPPVGRRTLLFFGGAAIGIVAVGLITVLVLVLNGQLGSGRGPQAASPPDVRPPLAKLCPAPTGPVVAPPVPSLPAVPGPRTTDPDAGISYKQYGQPWEPWPTVWRAGTLEVPYKVGQHIVTETYSGGEYHASILSAAVPATVNDSTAIDLECTGRQVAADVRENYYPQPNDRDLMRDERTVLGGRPAWVTTFRLHFNQPGLRARSELVSVALIDVGRPTAAILYVSVPETHRQWDYVVDEVLDTVRVI